MSPIDGVLTVAGPGDADSLLSCQLIRDTEGTVIAISGELDARTAHLVADVAEVAAQRCAGRVVLDLAGMTFLDAAGLSALLTAHEQLRAAGATVALRDLHPLAQWILRIADGVPTGKARVPAR